ncbi:hypothetical protein [Campylobacter sp. MIT 97-5078]|uniref:hypothetical protein n=1 Tax=Campylobacter sp. MIT 97-5078 TaxID=1548153 RepID=UPI000513B42F|nr:hypothetical protein [Campylobacter sp. MIT 97-5078]KGI55667.1 hypothetical protein LR59_10970 [Campylobacter sp. MIT 97-5078]KGI56811.1 hypothetical protein LR59_04835 [Campylobacter sp. MIT 97-5078]TQR25588.1 hypothetical protein DMB91_07230 [Campylobacter sp. MIT 97-5078]
METKNLNEEELDLMKQSIESMGEEEFNATFKREISSKEAKNSTLDIFPDPDIPIELQSQWMNEGLGSDEFNG